MKRLLILMVCAGAFGLMAQEGRPRIPLSGEWQSAWVANPLEQVKTWADKPATLPNAWPCPKGKNGLWLQREVPIPQNWKGRRCVLHISQPVIGAKVVVNGKDAGQIPGYGGEVDIGRHLRYGKSNRIRLYFGREGKGLELDRYLQVSVPRLRGHEKKLCGIIGLPRLFYLEAQNPDCIVDDVWYRSFVEGGKRIEPRVTVMLAKTVDLGIRVNMFDPETKKLVLRKDFRLGRHDAGTHVFDLKVPSEELKLWWPRRGQCYLGQVQVYDGRKEIDRTEPTQFGLRELRIDGRHYLMNGQRFHFIFDAYLFDNVEEAASRGVTLTLGKHAHEGASIHFSNHDWIERCDRLGMGVITFLTGLPDKMKDEAYMAAFRTWTEEHLKRERNHPSVMFWVPSTNVVGGEARPTKIGRAKHFDKRRPNVTFSTDLLHELDDTRPVFHHSGMHVGDVDTTNTYFNHTPIQEIEDWLKDWHANGDKPYMAVEFNGVQLSQDYIKHYTDKRLVSYATEYAASLAGADAYLKEPAKYRRFANSSTPRITVWQYNVFRHHPVVVDQVIQGHIRSMRACRYFGVPADVWVWRPKTTSYTGPDDPDIIGPTAIAKVAEDVLRPQWAWLGGPAANWTSSEHAFYAGDKVEKSVVLVNDQLHPAALTVDWKVSIGAAGRLQVKAGAYEHTITPIRFAVPAVAKSVGATLRMIARDDSGKIVHRDEMRLRFHPKPDAPAGVDTVAILDREGETREMLKTLGVRLTRPGKGAEVLVIGRRELSNRESPPFTADDVARGLRVVIFEQRCDSLQRMGLRPEDRCSRQLFPNTRGLLTRSLGQNDLRDWRGAADLIPHDARDLNAPTRRSWHWSNEGIVASNAIEVPEAGSFLSHVNGEFDLGYSALLSWRHGRGEVLLCQLDVTGRVGKEPAADRFMRNLMQYLAEPRAPTARKLHPSPAVGKLMTRLGFASSEELARDDLLVVSGADLNPQIVRFAEEGGDVLVIGAPAEALPGLTLKRKTSHMFAEAVEDHDLLRGVGMQHLHWREPVTLELVDSASRGWDVLLGGLVGVRRLGKGRAIVLQATHTAFDDYEAVRAADPKQKEKPIPDSWHGINRSRSRRNLNRLYATILTNLRVRSSDAVVHTLFEYQRKLPMRAVDHWTLLGNAADVKLLESAPEEDWYTPTDYNNGLGTGGKMEFVGRFGRQPVMAVTHIWTSKARPATIELASTGDVTLYINDRKVHQVKTGKERFKVDLPKHWVRLTCVVHPGVDSNGFQFRISDPSDLLAKPVVKKPKDGPWLFLRFAGFSDGKYKGMTVDELRRMESAPEQFPLYTVEQTLEDDPYLFMCW